MTSDQLKQQGSDFSFYLKFFLVFIAVLFLCFGILFHSDFKVSAFADVMLFTVIAFSVVGCFVGLYAAFHTGLDWLKEKWSQ